MIVIKTASDSTNWDRFKLLKKFSKIKVPLNYPENKNIVDCFEDS